MPSGAQEVLDDIAADKPGGTQNQAFRLFGFLVHPVRSPPFNRSRPHD
jgi:hypothetical protein